MTLESQTDKCDIRDSATINKTTYIHSAKMTVTKVIYWSFFLLAKLCDALHDGRELAEDYSNEWVVHLDGSNSSFDPDFLAAELGYQNIGEVNYRLNHTLVRMTLWSE
mgnify:CR=1 FL=1